MHGGSGSGAAGLHGENKIEVDLQKKRGTPMPSLCDYKNCHNLASSTYNGYCNEDHYKRARQMESQPVEKTFAEFREEYGFLVKKTRCWTSELEAYAAFKKLGHSEFMKRVREDMEYAEFCDRFYDELRTMWNICSAGMWEQFQKLKEKGWSLDEYAVELAAMKRAQRERAKKLNQAGAK